MRSAETSGVGAKGFGLPDSTAQQSRKSGGKFSIRALVGEASPVSRAVAITSCLAATLFIAFDAVQAVGESSYAQVELMALAPRPVGSFVAIQSPTQPNLELARVAASTPAASADVDGVWQRGLGAYGLAFLFSAVAYRRREPGTEEKARRRYQDLLETIPFGVACWTASGQLASCNPQYKARLGEEGPDATPGVSYQDSVKRLVQGGYLRLASEDESNRLLELHREDGSCLLIEERPLSTGGFVTLVTDITEQRRTDQLLASIREEQRLLARRYHEEKLRAEAASRSKTSFLAHLSHDIRTPLNHIIGFAELMRHQNFGPIGDARYLSYVETIKGSGERLLDFFSSILDLAELESGSRELRQENFSADNLIEATTRRYRDQAARAGLSIEVGPPTHAALMGDKFCLERMMGNIVENAIRFTPSGGKIVLCGYAASDGVVLEITDTGMGMSAERLEAVSQPFAFGDAAFARDHSGPGLGIAIARAIAEQSGGRLAIDSRPGLGTTVAISLPIAASAQVQAA